METRRAYTFINLYGLMLDAIMVNKILPRRADLGPYFDYWVKLQSGYLADIDGSFAPTPIFRTVLQEGEPIGVAALEAIGHATFGDTDPGALLFDERPIWLDQWNDEGEPGLFDLCLRLPFIDDGDMVDLTRNGTDLTITVGRLQRTIALPRILYDCKLGKHRYEDGVLRLEFHEAPGGGQSEHAPDSADKVRVEAA